jgi:adenylylsulfate kinase
VPINELRRRDPKGIYRRHDAGELSFVAGLDMPIDEPEAADYMVEFTSDLAVTELAKELNQILNRRK